MNPSEAIRELAERQKAAEDRQHISEDMRRHARELAERMSPEERERWAREWQKQNPQTPPPPADGQLPRANPPQPSPDSSPSPQKPDGSSFNQPGAGVGQDPRGDPQEQRPIDGPPDRVEAEQPQSVDLRGEEPGEQAISEFLDDGPDAPLDAGQRRRTTQKAEQVRRAQEVAERAVNESAVPSRYHQFIKRVFGNLNKTIESPPSSTRPAS